MIRLSIVFVVCLLAGCGPAERTQPQPVRPSYLVDAYRDGPLAANSRYTNQRVVCTLPAMSYSVAESGVGWLTGAPGVPPAVIFSCTPPADNKQAVEITGICKGPIKDGRRRGFNVDFYVLVADCDIRVVP